MLIDVVNGNLPTVTVVAEFTLRAILAAMQIRVAVLALYWGVAEIKILVAIDARHFRVPATQRKFSPRMVEFGFGAQRLPALRGVTLLARYFELVAVRATNRSIERDVLTERTAPGKENKAE
jgi:hypothetical protein